LKTFLGFLPFAATVLWTAVFYFSHSAENRTWRWSFALGCISLGSFVLVITEACSKAHLLHHGPILIAWIAMSLAPLLLLWHLRRSIHPMHEMERLRTKLSALPPWIALILSLTFLFIIVMATVTPPMNFDVQIYHLPRQIYWMMQGSVEPFAASHTHQISMPVLSEFLGLNLLILSGGDHWHNLVQSFFLLAVSGIVSLVAKSTGSSPRTQGLSILYIIFTPVIFFEASNAKNDIVLSFFVVIPLLMGMNIWTGRWKASLPLLLLSAWAAGLAFATKGTAIAYLPASALLIIAACIRTGAFRILLLAFFPSLLLSVLPAAPQLLRNRQVFHSPEGPNLHHSNLRHDPLSIASVALRDAAGQFTCGSESWNLMLERETRKIITASGQNADDPATTFEGQTFHLPYYAGLEDIVPAPVQTTLLLLLPCALLIPCFRRSRGMLPLFAVTFFSLLIFCLIFRWQPWQGRLLIPAYFMASPMAGIALGFLRPAWMPMAFLLLELLALRPHLVFAGQRPLIGGSSIFRMSKQDQMSRMMPGRSEEIKKLVAYLKEQGSLQSLAIDGGATEIYGLLRALRMGLPETTLLSSPAALPVADHPMIIESTTQDAGVPTPPRNPNPHSPKDYRVFWVGDYYRIFTPIGKSSLN